MTTLLIPEISKKRQYYIPKERYYELKHFCLQYSSFKEELRNVSPRSSGLIILEKGNTAEFKDPTFDEVSWREDKRKKIEIIEEAAVAADPALSNYILRSVCFGESYQYLRSVREMPCGKNMFYDRYRRFFFILDKLYRMA